MTARLLDEGTAAHGSEEFAELMERHGMVLGAGVSDGGLLVDVDVPQRHLATAAALLTEALAEPVFPDDEVRRILRNRLAEIEQERASSAHRAARELARTLWTPDDRASRPTAGTHRVASAALTRDDLVEFHATAVGPQGATVVVAGDLTGVDVVGVLEATLGTWSAPRHRPASTPVAPVPAADAARVVVVDRPGLGADRDRRGPPRPRPVHPRRAGRPTRCCPSCSVAPRAPASTPCCARRRATPTASAARSGRGSRAARSSRRGRCAPR